MTWVEVDGLMAWRRALRERAEKAEAALDRVRALCDEAEALCAGRPVIIPSLSTDQIRAAIEGSES